MPTAPSNRPSRRSELHGKFRPEKETQNVEDDRKDDQKELSRDDLLTNLDLLVTEWFAVLDVLDRLGERVAKGSPIRTRALERCKLTAINAVVDFAQAKLDTGRVDGTDTNLVLSCEAAKKELAKADSAVHQQHCAVEQAADLLAALHEIYEDKLAATDTDLIKLLNSLFPGRFFLAAPTSPAGSTTNIRERLVEALAFLDAQPHVDPLDPAYIAARDRAKIRRSKRGA